MRVRNYGKLDQEQKHTEKKFIADFKEPLAAQLATQSGHPIDQELDNAEQILKGVWGVSGEKAVKGAGAKKAVRSLILTAGPALAFLGAAVATGGDPQAAILGLGFGAMIGGTHEALADPGKRVEQALAEGRGVKAASKDARKMMKKQYGLTP